MGRLQGSRPSEMPSLVNRESAQRRVPMLAPEFWEWFGFTTAVGCAWLILSMALAPIIGRFIRVGMGGDDD